MNRRMHGSSSSSTLPHPVLVGLGLTSHHIVTHCVCPGCSTNAPAKQNKTILPVRCKLLPAIYFGCTNVNSCPLANCLQIDSLWTACRPPPSSSIVIMGGCSRLYSLCFTLWTGTGRPLPLLPSIHPPLLAPADYVCTRPHSLTQ